MFVLRPSHGRLRLLTLLAALVGLAAGGAAWVLLKLIAVVTNLALLHKWSWDEPHLEGFEPDATLPLVAVAGAAIVALLARWAPAIKGHGIPEAIDAVLTRQSRVKVRTAIAKPLSIAVSLGTGAPFGAEGPIIMTGGSIGSILGQVLPVTPSERKILLGCGAAGGTAAIFGTPMAAVVLALELLLFEFSVRSIVPLIVASSVAGSVHVALFGTTPLFEVPVHEFEGLGDLWMYALLGLACGLLAVVVCKGLFITEGLYRRLPGEAFHPLIGGLGFGLIGLAVPRSLGTGYLTIQDSLSAQLAAGTLALVLVAKLVSWWIALGSGTSGSLLAPLLTIGATFGALWGTMVEELMPGYGFAVGTMAFIAMAALFGSSIGASFTAIVFAFELTRDYAAVLPLMLAVVVADLVVRALLRHNLLTETLARKNVSVPRAYEPDFLRHTTVRAAMNAPAEALEATVSVAEARRRVAKGRHRSYPLVSADGACVGILTRTDLLGASLDEDGPVAEVASQDVVTISPDRSMLDAVSLMIDEEVNQLPVVEDGKLVGLVTRTDVIKAKGRHLDDDRAPVSWPTHWRVPIWHRRGRGEGADATAGNGGDGEPGDDGVVGDDEAGNGGTSDRQGAATAVDTQTEPSTER